MKKILPLDILIFLLCAVVGIFCIFKSGKNLGDKVQVSSPKGKYEFDLKTEGIFSVEGSLGITKIEISSGKVRIVESPCPNKTCVHQGFSEKIVCLPNKIVVTMSRKSESFDAISR